MSASDRLTGPLRAIAARSDPLSRYRALYGARVLAQSADFLKVDVQPDDPLLPPMSNIPLMTGVPGVTIRIAAGAHLLVGWENGRPDRPFAALWASPSETGDADAGGPGGGGAGDVLEVILAIADQGTIRIGSKLLLPGVHGVLTGESIDPFTGVPHAALGNASPFVLARNKN